MRFKADFGVSCFLLLACFASATDNFLLLPEVGFTDDLACRCFDCLESAPESEVGVFFSFFDFLRSSVLVCSDFSGGAAVFEFVVPVRFFSMFFLLLDVDLVCPGAGFPEASLGFGLSSCFFDFVRS